MERYAQFKQKLLSLCTQQPIIRAVILIGSQSREYCKADEYSDIDLIIACSQPEKMLYEDELLSKLGKIIYSFVEDTVAGEKERRILFEGSLDADLIIMTEENLKKHLSLHETDEILNRGYKPVYDDCGISSYLANIPLITDIFYTPISENEFKNLANDFMFHTVWAEKKIRRGELWTAIMCINGYLKSKLLTVIEMYEHSIHGNSYDTWHCGRMLEQWSEEFITEKLSSCFAHYAPDDLLTALDNTRQLFITLCRQCAAEYSYKTAIAEIDN